MAYLDPFKRELKLTLLAFWQGLGIDHTKSVYVPFLILSGVLASVSSVQLKYVYKSSGRKQGVNPTKQASLIESLTSSEVKINVLEMFAM